MSVSGPTQGDYSRTAEWKPRPWAARGVALLVRGGPIVVATAVGLLTARVLPHPHGWVWLLWLAAVIGSSQLALLGTERAVHQFTPLAALLRFSLVFPDEAPKRFSRSMRSGSLQKMQREMEATAREGLPADVQEAANAAIRMVASLNRHDRGTRGHSERVRAYTDLLADEMGLDKAFRDRLRWGAILHDMGKLTVPAAILNKPGRPNAEEWEILKAHPAEGGRILAPLAEWLGDAVFAASQHHERWDGKGYPLGLAGEEISLSARIVAVADAFAVMTAARSYKKPLPLAVAREELTKGAGSQFDADVVRAMLTVSLGKTSRLGGLAASLANVPFIGSLLSATTPVAVPGVMSSSAAALVITAGLMSPTGSDWLFDQPVSGASTPMVNELAFAVDGIDGIDATDVGNPTAARIGRAVQISRSVPSSDEGTGEGDVSANQSGPAQSRSGSIEWRTCESEGSGPCSGSTLVQTNPTETQGTSSVPESTTQPVRSPVSTSFPGVLLTVPFIDPTPTAPSSTRVTTTDPSTARLSTTLPPTTRPPTTRPLTTRPLTTRPSTSLVSQTKPIKPDPPLTVPSTTAEPADTVPRTTGAPAETVPLTSAPETKPPETKPPGSKGTTTSPAAETTPSVPLGTKPISSSTTTTTVSLPGSTNAVKPLLTLPPVRETLPPLG
jgi:hypothetical protein